MSDLAVLGKPGFFDAGGLEHVRFSADYVGRRDHSFHLIPASGAAGQWRVAQFLKNGEPARAIWTAGLIRADVLVKRHDRTLLHSCANGIRWRDDESATIG